MLVETKTVDRTEGRLPGIHWAFPKEVKRDPSGSLPASSLSSQKTCFCCCFFHAPKTSKDHAGLGEAWHKGPGFMVEGETMGVQQNHPRHGEAPSGAFHWCPPANGSPGHTPFKLQTSGEKKTRPIPHFLEFPHDSRIPSCSSCLRICTDFMHTKEPPDTVTPCYGVCPFIPSSAPASRWLKRSHCRCIYPRSPVRLYFDRLKVSGSSRNQVP